MVTAIFLECSYAIHLNARHKPHENCPIRMNIYCRVEPTNQQNTFTGNTKSTVCVPAFPEHETNCTITKSCL